ncbi:hypothetical protein AMTRI_Chr08g165680 [Amborella trichopoda]
MQRMQQSDRQWVVHIVNGNVRLNLEEEVEEWKHRCIYKIPSYLHKLHKGGLITPRIVSLGSLHHGSPHLQPMEHHNHKLRACYEWPDELPGMESPEFLNMMLLDGCFLLDLHRTTEDQDTTSYANDDLVFGPNCTWA